MALAASDKVQLKHGGSGMMMSGHFYFLRRIHFTGNILPLNIFTLSNNPAWSCILSR